VTATAALTTDLQQQVLLLEEDLRVRLQADAERKADWKQEHQRALEKERTATSWVTWRDDRITQAAVAWVLTSVFIRFCEDNALASPVWITGPQDRRQEALDAQLAYFRTHPEHTDREWLRSAIDYLTGLPATKALVEPHSALHLVSPSGDAVTKLLDFWRVRRDDGTLVHDLHDSSLSTRFLGDLYQDLSQHAKETYALLQTPVFVEEFILDRTLEPALNERSLEGFKLIDPTCGSGHFLLGAFDRLLDRWNRHAPGLEIQARVQATLDSIHGVDLNPFAIAIARFRLTVAALMASGLTSLEKAPAFTFRLAVGDSLIHGPDPGVLPGMSDRSAYMPFTYATEDGPLLLTMLEEGRYDVVVGNPPYITVRDKALNQIYRSKYANVCKGSYALTVPFMALFFFLAKKGSMAGWVGQITSNSFMKREFGAKLIEAFLIHQDLRLIVDTSGAFIPGHGTPTAIIVGRNESPVGSTVRAVLGVRGEPGRPEDPAKGLVWTSIVEHVDELNWDDGWVTITNLNRQILSKHPWSLAGGGAGELKERIQATDGELLRVLAPDIGFGAVTREDEAYMLGSPTLARRGIPSRYRRSLVEGKVVREWAIGGYDESLWPYSAETLEAEASVEVQRVLWPSRTILASRVAYGASQIERGLQWFEYSMFFRNRFRGEFTIAVPTVATHVHAALDRRRRVFKDSAVLIKLPRAAPEEDYLALLGALNSSVACFWLKQVCQDKGNRGGERSTARYAWEHFYQYNGSNVQDLPLPSVLPLARGRELDRLGQEGEMCDPVAVFSSRTPTAGELDRACVVNDKLRARMVSVQEELDWECYGLYGLIEDDLTYSGDDLPGLALGERAFEIVMARAVRAGDEDTAWFTRHGSNPITEIPEHWPTTYRELVQRRVDLIASDPSIRLLEKPEYKRRWSREPWGRQQERALREWLLDRLEDGRFWFDGQGRPLPQSVAQLADQVTRDADMVSVLGLWEGRPDVPVPESLVRLLADEVVPFLAAYRYKESGLRKREAWEETWRLQRREDAGEKVGPIAVPPKYTSADFRKNSYWQARGKLDVPKERFILYPDAGRETDATPLLGWAGWDHAQQSLALSLIIGDREKDGWRDERLVPLVAGLAELQAWIEQWHNEVDPDSGVNLAAFCREQRTARAAQVGKTLEELAAWRPSPVTRGRRARRPE
jgi:hypothetical protein